METNDRERTFGLLATMPAHLVEVAGRIHASLCGRRSLADGFSLVEQVWHLADLESDAFALRIRRLRSEDDPVLADFDGAAVAKARRYSERTLADGLAAFATARQATLGLLAEVGDAEWARKGRQAGVGALTLADLPRMIAAHDAAHREELDALRAEFARQALAETPARLAALIGEFSPAGLRALPLVPPAEVETLSPIGHACHLRDIEVDGYHVRIRRLRTEVNPTLASLPGDQMAIDLAYDAQSPAAVLPAFAQARERTLVMLKDVGTEEWSRSGEFEGYGPVTLLRTIEILAEHDRLHLEALAAMPR